MISKNLYFILIGRVLLITLTSLLMGYLWSTKNYPILGISVIFLLFQVVILIKFLNTYNRKIAYFFNSLLNEDFTLTYPQNSNVASINELNTSINKLNNKFQSTHLKNQAQEKYYQELLKQAEVGVLTINQKGHILFANPRAEKLLNHTPLTHIKQLQKVSNSLFTLLSSPQFFERKLIKISNERETTQLAIKSTTIHLNANALKLVTLQDINSELDSNETDSWIKLIRVLSHEIMNSITPITSISESLLTFLQNNTATAEENESDNSNPMKKGLTVIKNQGDDLIRFVQSYRSLLNVPKPEKTIINVTRLFEKISLLMENQMQDESIEFNIFIPKEFELYADEKQLTQVLLNLLKNASQSLQNQPNAVIELTASITSTNKKVISVTDNGKGITQELLSEIFVPFFTTKTNGSGIGLSLSKQIMQLHGGNIKVHSIENKETIFTILF